MSEAYLKARRRNGSVSGQLLVGPTVAPVTLVTCRNARWTIFVQTVRIYIATPGFDGSYWSLRDSIYSPVTGIIPTDHAPVGSPGYTNPLILDFGPDGLALTQGADLVFDPIASAASGGISWEAYMKPTSILDLTATNRE